MGRVEPPRGMPPDSERQDLGAMTAVIAEQGARGVAMLESENQSSATPSQSRSGRRGKESAIAACFAAAVERDLARLDSLLEEHHAMDMGPEMIAPLLWAQCEEAGGSRRTDCLVLVELLLAADRPKFAAILRHWIVSRHELLGKLAVRNGLSALAIDIIGLAVLAETAFAISNCDSMTYRLVAPAGIAEALARLTGMDKPVFDDELRALVDRYHINATHQPMTLAASEIRASVEGKNLINLKRKSLIIETAASIIEDSGVDAISARAVAKLAGVPAVMVFRYFHSIHELALAAMRKIIENISTGIELGIGASTLRTELFEARRRPENPPRRAVMFHRSMLQISLAAARSEGKLALGHLARRHLGMVSYATVGSDERVTVTRTRATSYSLWASAAFLVAPALGQEAEAFDFDAQALLAKQCLLTIDRDISLI